ncbi:MAG TPA: hypothetical protein VGD60_15375 [Candidatus Acidoferrales bacterium]
MRGWQEVHNEERSFVAALLWMTAKNGLGAAWGFGGRAGAFGRSGSLVKSGGKPPHSKMVWAVWDFAEAPRYGCGVGGTLRVLLGELREYAARCFFAYRAAASHF